MKKIGLIIVLLLVFGGCKKEKLQNNDSSIIFNMTDPSNTRIDFQNILKETDEMNYFTYTSIYMGGGVSVGDINNDGLKDIFFTGNQVKNRLYLNKGNLQFEDITDSADIAGDDRWYTGVTMADVNGDGFLDIYCSVSGIKGNKENQLYINNGDNTFSEKAKEYNINDNANSVQASFFDYDNDGDLDLYIANYPRAHVSTPNFVYKQRMASVKDAESDKLYRNDGNIFTNVSAEAGVKTYGFSLGVSVADFNNDGWQDFYVSNDYSIPDFFFINNKDGTFKEVVKQATRHTAFYGMGIDVADINNDGNLDFFQVDMDAKSNRRQKANMASMNPRLFNETVLTGFHYQYMHNCLQLNAGFDIDGIPQFSNISRLTGTSSTDWSWGPILADLDNDGHKDLFVTNGVRREVNNKDFFKKINTEEYKNYTQLQKSLMVPSEKLDNFVYKNNGNLNFEIANEQWGLSYKGFSTGVAYADLDNDGDLEVITNNVDDFASVFENKSSDTKNYIAIKFKGTKKNSFGLGNRVYVKSGESSQMQELTLTRGFQSSVAPELLFGLGSNTIIDELKVVWTDGKQQILNKINVNQHLILDYKEALVKPINNNKNKGIIFSNNTELFPSYKHNENNYDDFYKQVLLPHKMSGFGPALAVGDLNNDGLDDYFIGSSKGLSGSIYMQNSTGFQQQISDAILLDKTFEDVNATIFDADNDGDNDLYVVSGGNEFVPNSSLYEDRLYINDGKGNFTKDKKALPKMNISGSRVYTLDYNKDGKKDIMVLGRHLPWGYPKPVNSYILKNISSEKEIKFEDVTDIVAPEFKNLGMATSATFADVDKDGLEDIIIVGEWMPIKIFRNIKTGFKEVSNEMGLNDTTGWWWSIKEGDFDNDGDIDLIVGNNGLNYKYKATEDETFDIYVADFDKNNKDDIVLGYYNEGKQYPLRGRECSSQQIPGIKKKFQNYESFSEATLVDVYTKDELERSLHYQIKSFASIYLENKNGTFISHELPIESQLSSINQILVDDFDKDGHLDALVAGNLYASEVETPRNDAGYGLFLKGNGSGDFIPLPASKSGLYMSGDVKDIATIKIKNQKFIIAAKNNDYLQFTEIVK